MRSPESEDKKVLFSARLPKGVLRSDEPSLMEDLQPCAIGAQQFFNEIFLLQQVILACRRTL